MSQALARLQRSKRLRYLSVCSGIEAATVAWEPLGWIPVAFSEIARFPCAVLAHHYPNVPNLGDMKKINGAGFLGKIDVLVGGTPCQSFSVAGLRRGLEDERGNLAFEFVRLTDECNPAFIVWENVPGILSDRGNAFGCFLAALAGEDAPLLPPGRKWSDVGYVLGPKRTVAWIIKDAQYFGLAQRRRRVFLVACPRNGADPREILFEFEGLRRDSPPGQEPEKDLAPTLAARTRGGGGHGTDFECDGGLIAGTLDSPAGRSRGAGISPANITVACFGGNKTSGSRNVATALNACGSASGRLDFETETFVVGTLTHSGKAAGSATQQDAQCGLLVASALRAEGFDAPEDGTGRQNLVACPPLTRNQYGDHASREGLLVPCCDPRGRQKEESALLERSTVRRLTPLEWERLMGFPEGYTHISGLPSWRDMDPDEDPEVLSAAGFQVRQTKKGKWRVNDPDGPRYKALGESMPVPVVRWIGERIARHA